MSSLVIYLGGNAPHEKPRFPDDVVAVLAADSGLNHAYAHGVFVNKVVGDLDSVDKFLLADAVDAGTAVEKFPTEKNETDLELTLKEARNYKADSIFVIGGGGGRSDHFISNLGVLCGEQTSHWNVEILFEDSRIYVCRQTQPCKINGNKGDLFSLIPIGENAFGVTTSGAKWELNNATLKTDRALGLSNEFIDPKVTISLSSGNLAVVVPS